MPLDIVKTTSGFVSSVPGRDELISVFKGIPYAAPPVGKLRWRPPQSPSKWEGVRRADCFGSACIQEPYRKGSFYHREFFPNPVKTSEDCLYLNIWTPAQTQRDKLPVYLWIHGGGLFQGYGHSKPFDGENIAKMGIVVVTINYRLNIFGLLAHPELSKESRFGVSGNYAILDQIEALKWVCANIDSFGGDSNQITIGGQSGGGRCVGIHMVSPLTKGLFIRAISQSGCAVGSGVNVHLKDAEQAGQTLVSKIGAHSIEELRNISAHKLLSRFIEVAPTWPSVTPVIDGYVYEDNPAKVVHSGNQHYVALLSGSTNDEGVFNCSGMTVDSYVENANRFGDKANEYLKHYPARTAEEAIRSSNDYFTDHYFISHRTLSLMHEATSGIPTFQYLFTKVPPGRSSDIYGSFHTGELAYVFQNLDMIERPWSDNDRELSLTMARYWANFIKSGNPNGEGLERWSSSNESDMVMHFSDILKMEVAPNADRKSILEKCVANWLET